jgi:hypothetical protein
VGVRGPVLKRSDQRVRRNKDQFYDPSDWQFARFTLHFANKLIQTNRPSSQMLAAVNFALTELLVSEGARRRVRLEIEREQTAGTVIDVAETFRQQMTQYSLISSLAGFPAVRSPSPPVLAIESV